MEQTINRLLEANGDGRRLDVLFTSDSLSRSRAAKLIEEGNALVNGRVETKPSFKVPAGTRAALYLPVPKEAKAQPQDIPITVLYEDDCLAVVIKPCGMVVHPAAGNGDGTLVNALLYKLDRLSGVGGELRPGIVHRLDKDTSGVMLVAKNDETHVKLSKALHDREMEKHYRALVYGKMREQSGVIDKPIGRSAKDRKKMAVIEGGRSALTEWSVLAENVASTLLDVHIITGRTHQIRVHMAYIGHPVLGDPLYGLKKGPAAPRLMLHAYSLSFTHPKTGERMTFTAPCPF